jgi:hypothetical protein
MTLIITSLTTKCCYAERHIFIAILSVIMLYVIVMNVMVPFHAALLSDNYKAKAIKIFLL